MTVISCSLFKVKYADPNIHLIKQHYIALGLTDISLTYQVKYTAISPLLFAKVPCALQG
jgi:hypothetical protein